MLLGGCFMTEITEYGKFIRKIRKDRGDTLVGMSNKMGGVSIAFLSAIEVGKKQVPIEYADRISEIYNLTVEENQELTDAIGASNANMNLDFTKMSQDRAQASVLFARKINKLSQKSLEELRKLLTEDSDE